ncbi:MAG: mechanosensitive ion channel family protein [bacterium]|nr:mechanosensitive ion channel family protein [bacterium]
MLSDYFDKYDNWMQYGDEAISILIIVIAALVVIHISKIASKRVYKVIEDDDPDVVSEREQRARTLIKVIRSAVFITTVIVATMLILQRMGMDITPILASAGVVGLAIGFGAQSLVKDVLSGFFILLEDLYCVGDEIEIGGKSGVVTKLNVRGTTLRSTDGVVHYVPNGEVTTVSNKTKDWSAADLTFRVSYGADIDYVIDRLEVLCEEIHNDEKYGNLVIGKPQILGVESLGESSIDVRLVIKTLPGMQSKVAREFRRMVKKRFDDESIEIPYPHLVTIKKMDVSQD